MSDENDIEGTMYHIRVKGNLDPKWADWFEGFALVASPGDDETLLSGRVTDQAALYGMLGKLNSLGLHLALVIQIEHPYPGERCRMCGQYIYTTEES